MDAKKIIEESLIPGFELGEIIYFPEQITDRIIVSGSYEGKKALLKIVDSRNATLMDKFQREIETEQAISEFFASDIAHNFPSIYKSDQLSEYSYLIRSYFDGQPLANYKTDENTPTIISYEHLVSIEGVSHETIIARVAEIMADMDHFDQAAAEKYSRILKRRFEVDITKLDIAKIEEGYGISLDNHLKFCDEIVAQNLHNANLSPVVGDLVPANIIIGDSAVKIIDIEWFCIDHRMIDVALLWLTMHRYSALQKMLIERFVKDELAETLFRYSVIRIILSYKWYGWLKRHNHIWSRYLKAAGESYEELINVGG